MEKELLENLRVLYEIQTCKTCIFNDHCEVLLDNHKDDICKTIYNKLILEGEE